MTVAQSWVLLGIFATMASGLLALVTFSQQNLKSLMIAKFDAVDARFGTVDQRFDGVDHRLDSLDRDVQALADRVFRDRP